MALQRDCPSCECGGNLCGHHGCGMRGCTISSNHTHKTGDDEWDASAERATAT